MAGSARPGDRRPERVSVTVLWSPAALFVLYRLSRSAAETVDGAVLLLAHRGEGHLEWVAPYHRLRAGKHDVMLAIDPDALAITVLSIFRARE